MALSADRRLQFAFVSRLEKLAFALPGTATVASLDTDFFEANKICFTSPDSIHASNNLRLLLDSLVADCVPSANFIGPLVSQKKSRSYFRYRPQVKPSERPRSQYNLMIIEDFFRKRSQCYPSRWNRLSRSDTSATGIHSRWSQFITNRARSRYSRSSLRVLLDRRYYYRLPELPVKFMMSRLMAFDSRENDPLCFDAAAWPLFINPKHRRKT